MLGAGCTVAVGTWVSYHTTELYLMCAFMFLAGKLIKYYNFQVLFQFVYQYHFKTLILIIPQKGLTT